MSLTSETSLADNVLLLFKNDLREQQRELAHAIDRDRKEIRALVDSRPRDVVDESCGDVSKEAVFASYSRNRTRLRTVGLALERISSGNFGICAACDGAIGLKRLQAVPWATADPYPMKQELLRPESTSALDCEPELEATIASLKQHFEAVRQHEVKRLRGRLGHLSSTQESAIESLTHGIIDQFLHAPVTVLKAASEDDDSPAIIQTVHRIFNLEPQLLLRSEERKAY